MSLNGVVSFESIIVSGSSQKMHYINSLTTLPCFISNISREIRTTILIFGQTISAVPYIEHGVDLRLKESVYNTSLR